LVGLCETRFIERHDAINVFVELLEPIIISLQDIQETNRSVSSSASSFLAAVEKSSYIISLLVCESFKLYASVIALSTKSCT